MTLKELKTKIEGMRKKNIKWSEIALEFGTYSQRLNQLLETADKNPKKLVPSDILLKMMKK